MHVASVYSSPMIAQVQPIPGITVQACKPTGLLSTVPAGRGMDGKGQVRYVPTQPWNIDMTVPALGMCALLHGHCRWDRQAGRTGLTGRIGGPNTGGLELETAGRG